MVNWTGNGPGQLARTLRVTLNHVLSPGKRGGGSWGAPIMPHGAHCCEITLSPPSGSTMWIPPSLISAADPLVTCTPSWSSRPDCAEHVPMAWLRAGPSPYGTSWSMFSPGAGAGDAEPWLAIGGLTVLDACRFPAAYPAASPMISPTASRIAATRGGRQFSDGKWRPPCSNTSVARSSAPSSFTWLG